MQQNNQHHIRELLEHSHRSCINFLIGENGSGKSRLLADLGQEILNENNGNILLAISNSPYTKFPPSSYPPRYKRLLLGNRYNTPSKLIKKIIYETKSNKKNDIEKIYHLSRILDYLKLPGELGFSLRLSRTEINENLVEEENSFYSNDYLDPDEKEIKDILSALTKVEANYWEALGEVLDEENKNKDDKKNFANTIINKHELNNIAINFYHKNSHLIRNEIWIDIRNIYSSNYFEIIKSLISLESTPGSNIKIDVLIRNKNNHHFLLDSISSGESSLFCTFSFIYSNINNNTWILIDEPENSLHPKWQREYCDNILNHFHYFGPKITIATHSPMIVSGATSADINGSAYLLRNNNIFEKNLSDGIEEILMDAFDTITPKNHYLSEQSQILLDDLYKNKITLNETLMTIEDWQNKSSERNQKEFLLELKKLAIKIKRRTNER